MQRSSFHREETPCRGGSLHREEALPEEAPNRVALSTNRMPFIEKVSCTESQRGGPYTERRPFVNEAPCRDVLENEAPLRNEAFVEEAICTERMSLVEEALDTGLIEGSP